jgi:hypothetical protein
MNINPDYENQHIPSSSEVMDGIQGIIYNMLIKPMQKKLDLEDIEVLGKVGDVLQSVAEKATAYERLNEGTLDKNYRN